MSQTHSDQSYTKCADMHDLIEQKRAVVTSTTDGTAAERTESIMGALEARMMARARA